MLETIKMKEKDIFEIVLNHVERIFEEKQKPVRIAVNGIEGTGKTVFAHNLTESFISHGKSVFHVSIDGFHFDKKRRYKQGRDSAIGYYEDSYDELSFAEKVLLSSQKTPAHITLATHDLSTDKYLNLTPMGIPKNSILITDGAYLFKPLYRDHWDLKIYLKTDYQTALRRGVKRDSELLGGLEMAETKFKKRYHEASKIYIRENRPLELADIVIDNTDFECLTLEKIIRPHGEY